MKVLVVDDNKDLADLIQSVLEREGAEVMSANDGIQGYANYLVFKPDLVITDIQMPGGTGFEMMRHIRAHNPTIKTVYMSGNIDAYRMTLEREKKKYPITFFTKPFRLKSLMELVSEPGTSSSMEDPAMRCHQSLRQTADGLPSSQ
jgi:CheY-like chemotaxis protein